MKLRVSGSDALRFLNGQITNDARKASDDRAIEACVLNAKGKLNGHLFLHRRGEDFVVDADAELAEQLPQRLDRYIIADDVQVTDVTREFALFHVVDSATPVSFPTVRASRFFPEGRDIWMPAADQKAAHEVLMAELRWCDAECAELMRIERGLARWGRELTDEIIPIEANLEERCVDYAKGCYIGQEVISRMKMSGQTNKRLCKLQSRDGTVILPGTQLLASAEGAPAGWVTSVAEKAQGVTALGYVKRGCNSPGSILHVASDRPAETGGSVEVVPFPIFEEADGQGD